MKHISIVPSWVLSMMIACAVAAMASFLVPNFSAEPGLRVAPDEIRVLDAGPYSQVRRPSVNDTEIYLRNQFSTRQSKPRQFSYVFNPNEWPNDLAIFAPIIGGEARISINGAPFARSKQQILSSYGFGDASLYTVMNPRYFHPGRNRLDILLAEDPKRTGLRSLYVGKITQVETLQKKYAAWLETLKMTGVLNGLIGLICAGLGLLLGGHRLTMLGALIVSAIVVFHSTNPFAFPALSHPITSPALILIGAVLFLLGLKSKPIKNGALIKGLALAALFGACLNLYTILTPSHINHPITLASMGLLTLYPVLFAGLPLILSSDVVNFREQARLAQAEARKKDEIISDQSKALRREIEQKAVMEERQRFTRDMHDGIGGQLLSLLVRVRSGRVGLDGVETEIQSGINDLRLVVDSLDHVGDDLSAALVTFQSRARAQFEAADITLTWEQSETLNAARFGTRHVLNLYRFLQEAVSNILRHANARQAQIKVLSSLGADHLTVIVEDDGQGIGEVQSALAGKGLKNMKARANRLGGMLEFGVPYTGTGTRIQLKIPLEPKT